MLRIPIIAAVVALTLLGGVAVALTRAGAPAATSAPAAAVDDSAGRPDDGVAQRTADDSGRHGGDDRSGSGSGWAEEKPGRAQTTTSNEPRVETFPVADAGSVTLAIGDGLEVVEVLPSHDGWRIERGPDGGREVEVSFRDGRARVDWKAQLEGGEVRLRVRDRRVEDDRGDDRARDDRGRGSDDPPGDDSGRGRGRGRGSDD